MSVTVVVVVVVVVVMFLPTYFYKGCIQEAGEGTGPFYHFCTLVSLVPEIKSLVTLDYFPCVWCRNVDTTI